MTSAIELKSPDGTNKVRLEHPENVSKTINIVNLKEEADIQTMIENRAGSAGAFSFRNKIIDGRFDIWREGTSQTSSGYGSDTMWLNTHNGSTKTHQRLTLTPGVDLPAIEVPSAKYYSRTVVTTSGSGSTTATRKYQHVEGVRTLAGKTITLSFYAKADASKPIWVGFEQSFGNSGISDVPMPFVVRNLTSSWARYSVTINLPSVSGKTIGTANDCLRVSFWFDVDPSNAIYLAAGGDTPAHQPGAFDIACVQLEEGEVATPFEELPMAIVDNQINRYFLYSLRQMCRIFTANNAAYSTTHFPVTMRVTPTIKNISGTTLSVYSIDDRTSILSYTTSSIGVYAAYYTFDARI